MTGPASDTLRPPSVKLAWTATAYTTSFLAYRVYRRPTRMPAVPWTRIGHIGVGTNQTATQVEAKHTAFVDYEAGWYSDGGQWAAGWDYAVTVMTSNGLESLFGTTLSATVVTGAKNAWITCNRQPWMNTPARIYETELNSKTEMGVIENQYVGRDFTVTRTPARLPSRTFEGTSWTFDPTSTDQIRYLRTIEASGESVALLRPLGDRIIGNLKVPSWNDVQVARTTAAFSILETSGDSVAADYNLPAGLTLNGTTQYASTASSSALNPTTVAFSIVVVAVFPSTSGAVHLSKGNLGTSDGYGFRNSAASTMQFFVDGATTSGGPADASSAWYDSKPHVAVGTHSGTIQKLYRDRATTPVAVTSTTTGTVTNALAFVAGANNAGASGFSALAPLYAWAFYPRELSGVEAQAAAYWLLGYHGYRMPYGANVFYDWRDQRSHGSTGVIDISGNGVNATLAASPSLEFGFGWPLAELEKFSTGGIQVG